MKNKFKIGESIICLINSKAKLTVGKEYKVMDIMESYLDNWDDYSVIVVNDSGELQWYNDIRFVNKEEFRTQLINDIIKK